MFLHFLQTKEQKEAFLELAHLAANADGFIHKKEQGFLQSYMQEMDMQQAVISFSSEKQLADILGNINDDHVKKSFSQKFCFSYSLTATTMTMKKS